MPPPAGPIIVVEGTRAAFERVVAGLEAAGWSIARGFDRPLRARTAHLRAGVVRDAQEAAAALLATLDGAGVVILAQAPDDVVDRLLGDLRHVGPVDLRRELAMDDRHPGEDAVAILRILAEGRTLGDAAAELGLSRRTADRRLADARRALGADRTVEAVARARRLGWLR